MSFKPEPTVVPLGEPLISEGLPSHAPRPGEPVEPGDSNRMLIIGLASLVALLLILVLALGAAGVMWYMGQNQPTPALVGETVQTAAAGDNNTEAVGGAAGGIEIEVDSPDEQVQWIRIRDADEERVLSGTPDGSASLEPGTYLLQVKVIARAVVEHELTVEDPLSLSCVSESKQRVICTDADAGLTLELLPE